MENKEILLKEIETQVGELVGNQLKATETQIKSLEEKVNALKSYDDTELKNEVIRVSALIEAMKESAKPAVANKSLKDQLAEVKDSLKAMKSGESKTGLTIKAVGDMSIANNVTGQVPQAQRIAGLNLLPLRPLRFLDALTRASASSNLIEWVYQTGREGAAGQTEEGAAKNQIDFDMVVASQKIEKTTAYIRVSDEMLDDVDFIASEIQNDLLTNLLLAVETGAYSGNGGTPALNGVYTVATTFNAGASANTIDSANEIDVLGAAFVQIQEANFQTPNFIFMHPRDLYRIKSIKVTSSDRRYIDPVMEIVNQGSFMGATIIPTTLVSVGTFLCGDFSRAFLFEKQAPSLEIGYNADDFVKNFKTIRAEWRGAVVVKNNDRKAFIKGTFSTAKAALETT
jgi:HK97 family phage major capsid protein